MLPATAKRPVLTTAEVAVLGDIDAIHGRQAVRRVRALREGTSGGIPRSEQSTQTNCGDQGDVRRPCRRRSSSSNTKTPPTTPSRAKPSQYDHQQNAGTFSIIFQHGKRNDLANVNPAADVPLRDVGHGIVERFLGTDEEKRLREVLQRKIDSHDPIKQPELRKQAIHRLLNSISLKSGNAQVRAIQPAMG